MSAAVRTLITASVRCLAAFVLLAAAAADARAQATILLEVPSTDPFPAAPRIVVRAVGVPSGDVRSVRLRLSINPQFGLIVFDSTITGTSGTFTLTRLLPEGRDIFAEGSVQNQSGTTVLIQSQRAGRTGPRLALVNPDGRTGISLNTRQPVFQWRSAAVTAPPGPWLYELFVTNVATGETRSRIQIADTIYAYPDTLQSNTSYRWRVVARLSNGAAGDSAVASSLSSFVIAPSDAPVTTLLYQNFPNPFPAASSPSTCIWFDLRMPSRVSLRVLDLRGHRVRTLIPGVFGEELPSGRYGRLLDGSTGCDPRLTWDGTGDDGRTMPPGIYLLMLRADGRDFVRKMIFNGR